MPHRNACLAARAACIAAVTILAVARPSSALRQHRHAALDEQEQDRLRDAHDPSDRIKVYLDLAQARLAKLEDFRSKPMDPAYDNGKYMREILTNYVKLDDELKDWIQYQYDHQGDMRKGLAVLLDTGPKQLAELHSVLANPDPYANDYRSTLQEAIDDLDDTLDGATQALAGQRKKFGELKQQEKMEERQVKETEKEARKRQKQEEKLRKREQKEARKHGVTNDDQN